MPEHNTQAGPAPTILEQLVGELAYKPGWTFSLENIDRGQGCAGLTFIAHVVTADGYHPERRRGVLHYMIVPAAAYDRRSWIRWLLEQILLIEQHEACEFFRFEYPASDDRVAEERPYRPNHGPGRDPYTIIEVGTDEDARTSFRGEVKP